jgi:hypothetical protein
MGKGASALDGVDTRLSTLDSQRLCAIRVQEYVDMSGAMGGAMGIRCHHAPHAWALGWTDPIATLTSATMPSGAPLPFLTAPLQLASAPGMGKRVAHHRRRRDLADVRSAARDDSRRRPRRAASRLGEISRTARLPGRLQRRRGRHVVLSKVRMPGPRGDTTLTASTTSNVSLLRLRPSPSLCRTPQLPHHRWLRLALAGQHHRQRARARLERDEARRHPDHAPPRGAAARPGVERRSVGPAPGQVRRPHPRRQRLRPRLPVLQQS